MATEQLRLMSNQVKVGAPLPFNVRDELGQLLLARGYVVSSSAQLAELLARGIYVDIEEIKALKEGHAPPEEAKRLTLFDLWGQAVGRLDRLLRSVDTDPGFAARCDEFAVQFGGLVQRDPDIGIYVAVRQDERRLNLYGLTHSLHAAMVCQLLALRMGWAAADTRSLVKAALTMNLSIIELQGRVAALGRLSEAQRLQISAHPEKANERLRAAGVDDAAWLEAVLQHHERPGGDGYPGHLTQISEMASVLRLVDVFLAKITARAERPAVPIHEAAKQMFSESGGSPFAAAIIKEFGIYPPGNFVQLASGEMAVVIRRGATAHTPTVAAITNKDGVPTVNTTVRDTSRPQFAIKALAFDKAMMQRLAPERLYGLAE